MSKGLEYYKEFINELVQMSESCATANNILKGKILGIGNEETNTFLEKLSQRERELIAELVLSSYDSGIYDVLDHLEWLQCCKDMKITIEDEVLPLKDFEGFACDYIGRKSKDWNFGE